MRSIEDSFFPSLTSLKFEKYLSQLAAFLSKTRVKKARNVRPDTHALHFQQGSDLDIFET